MMALTETDRHLGGKSLVATWSKLKMAEKLFERDGPNGGKECAILDGPATKSIKAKKK